LILTFAKRAPFRRHLGPGVIQALIPFFNPDREATDPIPVARAEKLSDLFLEYYFFGTPFRRDALAAIWQRCEDGGDHGCRRERAGFEQIVGPLGAAPVAVATPQPE
jgi:hypothetical protein